MLVAVEKPKIEFFACNSCGAYFYVFDDKGESIERIPAANYLMKNYGWVAVPEYSESKIKYSESKIKYSESKIIDHLLYCNDCKLKILLA